MKATLASAPPHISRRTKVVTGCRNTDDPLTRGGEVLCITFVLFPYVVGLLNELIPYIGPLIRAFAKLTYAVPA